MPRKLLTSLRAGALASWVAAGLATASTACGPQAPAEAALITSTFAVDGMVCGSCEEAIRSTLGRIEGVSEVEVSHREGRMTIRHDPARAPAPSLVAAVEKLGYTVASAAPDSP